MSNSMFLHAFLQIESTIVIAWDPVLATTPRYSDDEYRNMSLIMREGKDPGEIMSEMSNFDPNEKFETTVVMTNKEAMNGNNVCVSTFPSQILFVNILIVLF